jgi:signal transduction histidine kinase/CheY-like chemotaxis protein
MKRQIVIGFALIFSLFTLGSGVLVYNIYTTSNNLRSLIGLHKIEDIRHELFYSVQKVQTYVHAPVLVFSKHLDEIIVNASRLDKAINNCHGCHHEPDVLADITATQHLVENFEEQLSYLITMIADTDRRRNMQSKVSDLGNEILTDVQIMITRAGVTVQKRTAGTLELLSRSYPLLGITLLITLFLALFVAKLLTRRIIHPIDALVNASRKISDGKWGYQTDFKATGEFAELVKSFNNMSISLSTKKKQNQQQMMELKNTQKQLVEAEKLTAIGTLAGGIAHDFNNILCGMIGHLNLLRTNLQQDDDENQEIINTIETAGFRAAELIKQLLAFARQKSIHKKAVDINKSVTNVFNLIKNSISKKITTKISLAHPAPCVTGDPVQIEQVIMNLCVNARDALSEDGNISISTEHMTLDQQFCANHPDVRPGNYVKLEISDTGSGIDEDVLPRIFEPFFTTKEVGLGTGLGLAMVYGVIKSHDGLCLVDSTLGEGTTFTIYLPSSKEIAPASKAVTPVTPVTKSTSATILIVDDEAIISSMLIEYLQELGYKTMLAVNGQEAVDIVTDQKDAIDLVILDINMPIMNGAEAYKNFIKIKPNLKVLVSTGYITSAESQEIIRKGAQGLIQKPFKMDDIRAEINRILKIQ